MNTTSPYIENRSPVNRTEFTSDKVQTQKKMFSQSMFVQLHAGNQSTIKQSSKNK